MSAPFVASLRRSRRAVQRSLCVLGLALLAACGGGGGDPVSSPFTCDLDGRKAWMRDFFGQWYFWYRLSPSPDPAPYTSLDGYFEALLYTGTEAAFPADRWSGYESTESFNRYYGDGQTLGYGLAVAGLEVRGLPEQPLFVRYVAPASDAAAQGIRRGDQVLALDGRPVAQIIAADDFSALVPQQAGDQLTVDLWTAQGARTVVLRASIYSLTPVPQRSTFTTLLGRKVGYLMVNNMIDQGLGPLETAFQQFRAEGVQDLVLDLRYNGGGLISVATSLASYIAGQAAGGQPFSTLLYNDQRAAGQNQSFNFQTQAFALGLSRVYVLTGPRTCSASEQVINGLRPFVDVVTVGDTSCGKPVGFLPQAHCDNTFSIVNFEAVNARNEGRYFDGLEASCRVAENHARELGDASEPLLATALVLADGGSCPQALRAASGKRPLRALTPRERRPEPGERQGMLPR